MITAFTLWLNSKYDSDYFFIFLVTFSIDMAIFDIIKTFVSA
jgi:hypothetical protein